MEDAVSGEKLIGVSLVALRQHAGTTTNNLFDDKIRGEFFTTDALFNGHSPLFVFKTNTYTEFKKMAVEITSLTYHSYNYLNSASMAWEKNEDGL